MKFLYPAFLWALLTLIIPILIHIFNFRRIKRIYFSNVSLLKEVKTQTNSFRRLKHLLILLSRLAFITFLVLAFAQPYLPSKNQKNIQNASGLVNIYVDNSFSMQSELDNETYLDLASVYVSDLVKVFPDEARFQLMTNNFENEEQFPVTASEVEDRLTETSYANVFRDLNTLVRRQSSLLERHSPRPNNQIFWFSDFQKSTVGDLNEVKLDSLNQYYIVPIKSGQNPNLMIDSVWLENPFIKSLEVNQINIRLKSFSKEDYIDVALKLFVEDKQVSSTTVNINALATETVKLDFTVQEEGVKACRIAFEDFPVVFDNDYFFVMDASPKVNILHLYDKPKNRYVENVYDNESVFQLNSFSVNNLDYNRINSAELVILNEVTSIEGELSATLRKFVQEGGSLVVFPSPELANSFNSFLSTVSISGVKALRPDSLGSRQSNRLALLNVQNPFYQGVFEKVPTNMDMPYANAVASWNNVGENLLLFKNRQPYLSRFQVQRGNVYMFAAPLESSYSNFAKHAIFVPIMYKIASSSKSASKRLAYSFQEKTLSVSVSKPATNQVYKLVKDNLELVPSQRIVGENLVMELPEQMIEAGYYKLMLEDQQEGLLAFNYDKAESRMDFYSLEEIQSVFGSQKNVQIFDSVTNKNFIEDFKAQNIQVNLWKYMLIFALACFFIEIVLIRVL